MKDQINTIRAALGDMRSAFGHPDTLAVADQALTALSQLEVMAGGSFVLVHDHAWIVETNTDLTEGRGRQQITHVAEKEATAARLAKGKYIMGGDCPITRVELILHNGRLYGPVTKVPPSKEDAGVQLQLDSRRAAEAKARAAGLSDEEIRALKGTP